MIVDTSQARVRPRVEVLPWPQICLALAALALGVLVYVVDRPPGLTALPDSITLFQPTVSFFGAVGQSLPAFVHVFAFSVLTAALLGGGRCAAITVCTAWFLVDAAFELGQHPATNAELAKLIPSWFEAIPVLDRTDDLFRYGTFDPLDLLSIILGAFAAYALTQRTQLRRISHD